MYISMTCTYHPDCYNLNPLEIRGCTYAEKLAL